MTAKITRYSMPGGRSAFSRTKTFTGETVPRGLLAGHALNEGVWGKLHVVSGTLKLVFEGAPEVFEISEGGNFDIPPIERHHVKIEGPVSFYVDFYK